MTVARRVEAPANQWGDTSTVVWTGSEEVSLILPLRGSDRCGQYRKRVHGAVGGGKQTLLGYHMYYYFKCVFNVSSFSLVCFCC